MLVRLSDPAVPGADKIGLVELATADDAAALDKFGRALADNGALPLTFDATDLKWSETQGRQRGGDRQRHDSQPAAGQIQLPDGVHPGPRQMAADP